MDPAPRSFGVTPLSLLLIITLFSLVLVPAIAVTYSYDMISRVMSGIAALVLLATAAGLWIYRPHLGRRRDGPLVNQALRVGMGLGLLWIVEISINNFIAPPLPARDIIDNVFWGVIALSILALAIVAAFRTKRLWAGIEVGVWSGLASGALACGMALAVVVFGMPFITHDPLNVAEWASRGPDVTAPTMAAYFAYETLAGALGHLVVLGVAMGGLLGIVGGLVGKGIVTGIRSMSSSR